MLPDCKRVGYCTTKWWYPAATWLFFRYRPPGHECPGEISCDHILCPENEWSCYFFEYWKNYCKETVYEFKHGFLNMPTLEDGSRESSISGTWYEEQRHYFDDPIFGDPVDLRSSYEFSDFAAKSHETHMTLVYGFMDQKINFLCLPRSTGNTFAILRRGGN
jgi:hypothetical protein